MLIVFGPKLRLIRVLAVPEATVTLLTFTVADASSTVGVTVVELVASETLSVHALVKYAKLGEITPALRTRLERYGSLLGSRAGGARSAVS